MTSDAGAPQGSLGGACFNNSTCDEGLVCVVKQGGAVCALADAGNDAVSLQDATIDAPADVPSSDANDGGSACDAGLTLCNASCVDLSTDNNNCGGCGLKCSTTCGNGGHCPVVLATGGNTADLRVDATTVYWVSQISPGSVERTPIAGGQTTDVITTSVGVSYPYNIATDATSLYLADYYGGKIYKTALGGGTPTAIASSQSNPFGIAVDASYVYFACSGGSIAKVPLGGGTVTTLASGQSGATALTIDANNVYWTTKTAVRQVPLGGGTITTIATGQTNAGPLGQMAVDASNVFWVDGTANTVMKAPIGGSSGTAIASNENTAFGIAIDATNVYFTIKTSSSTIALRRVSKSGGTVDTIATEVGTVPGYVAVDGTSVYYTNYTGGHVVKVTPK